MLKNQKFKVAGVDGCKGGWLVAIASIIKKNIRMGSDCIFRFVSLFVVKEFQEVISNTLDCELVCVDIPVGLSNREKPRACDTAARKILSGQRASSVFPTPIRL